MNGFCGDACPVCGERTELEYGTVYAENGEAWHSVTCLACGACYTACYVFSEVIDVEQEED